MSNKFHSIMQKTFDCITQQHIVWYAYFKTIYCDQQWKVKNI